MKPKQRYNTAVAGEQDGSPTRAMSMRVLSALAGGLAMCALVATAASRNSELTACSLTEVHHGSCDVATVSDPLLLLSPPG